MKNYKFIVEKEYDNLNLKLFLKNYAKLSESIIIQIKFGNVKINDKVAITTDIVHFKDVISISMPEEKPNDFATAIFIDLDILYEDDYFIAINKPSGMLTHNCKGGNVYSLENALYGYFYPNPFVFRAINRLDKDTSGIVIVAKDIISAWYLSSMVLDRKIKKYYKAVVCGSPKTNHGFIDAPIKKLPDNVKRIISEDGKPALTEYYLETKINNELSIMKYVLHTGRTHQIRIHSAHIGCPLYSDKLYSTPVEHKTYFLCAYKMELTHPFTNENLCIQTKSDLTELNL